MRTVGAGFLTIRRPVARNHWAYRQQDGFSERALFVIDAEGTIRWSYLSPLDINPGAEGILDALEALGSKREAAE
jgi:alkyl hydroperoxide reductase subunit AhpC